MLFFVHGRLQSSTFGMLLLMVVTCKCCSGREGRGLPDQQAPASYTPPVLFAFVTSAMNVSVRAENHIVTCCLVLAANQQAQQGPINDNKALVSSGLPFILLQSWIPESASASDLCPGDIFAHHGRAIQQGIVAMCSYHDFISG